MLLNRRSFLAAIAAPWLPLPTGRFVRNVPLGRFEGRPAPRFDVLLGSGLDARQFTDLSTLTPETLITPNDKFFIRTSATSAHQRVSWTLGVGGRVERPLTMTADELREMAKPAGTHLMECAGNTDPANFGLMSAARWEGVPVAALLDRIRPKAGAWRVRVNGVDETNVEARSSLPGASWIFHRDDFERTGAFLATRMNGVDLPPDHGYPVRLLVPGWYGCACIKWVSSIELVGEDEPATPQMIEFSRRTHQDGVPALARDYAPPVIDLAAMPVRVEEWDVEGRRVYRVIGIVWGGQTPARSLAIRFRHNEPFVPLEQYEPPASTATWSLWSHTWRPSEPGRYRIVLRADEASIRTRRLDLFFYARDAIV